MITNGLESKVFKNKELARSAEFAVLAALGCFWDDEFVVFVHLG
jgi:hypothetical protein